MRKRCWFFFHEWTDWIRKDSPTGHITFRRHCCQCGKYQFRVGILNHVGPW